MKRAPLLGSLAVAAFASLVIGCFRSEGPLEWKDTTPPSKVINLTVVEAAGDSVVLTWSAPGNDSDSGRASRYDLRYAPQVDSTFQWSSAHQANGLTQPSPAGTIERVAVHGLNAGVQYRFALKTLDGAGNSSELSNIVDEYYVAIIPDSVLAECLRTATHQAAFPVSVQALAALDAVSCLAYSVRDLRGLEHCTQIQSLEIAYCQCSDIHPVAPLTNLTTLVLLHSTIQDITPVGGLTRLERLMIKMGEVKDISPVKSLTALQRLDLAQNQITDLTPVTKLTSLIGLGLGRNQITDISPVAGLTQLVEIDVSYNPVGDISVLAGLPWLRTVGASDCGLADITPLTALSALNNVGLLHNNLTDLGPLVENPAFANGAWLNILSNPLSEEALNVQIPALQARGVNVTY